MIKESKNSCIKTFFFISRIFFFVHMHNILKKYNPKLEVVWNMAILFRKEFFFFFQNLNSVLNCLLSYNDKSIHFSFLLYGNVTIKS